MCVCEMDRVAMGQFLLEEFLRLLSHISRCYWVLKHLQAVMEPHGGPTHHTPLKPHRHVKHIKDMVLSSLEVHAQLISTKIAVLAAVVPVCYPLIPRRLKSIPH